MKERALISEAQGSTEHVTESGVHVFRYIAATGSIAQAGGFRDRPLSHRIAGGSRSAQPTALSSAFPAIGQAAARSP
jgi:hypothetical protein